jgi:hypothetical protein
LRWEKNAFTCLFVDLDGGLVSFYPYDFSRELVVANFTELVHSYTGHLLGHNDGARDGEDRPRLLVVIIARAGLLCCRHSSICASG